jgi:spore germination protein GerM
VSRTVPRPFVLVVIGLVLVAGGVGVWWLFLRGPAGPGEEMVVEEPTEQGTRSVTLFFGDRQGQGLVSERRTITAYVHRDEEIEAVVAELLAGPRSQRAVRTWPEGTRLRGAFYDEGLHLLYLDFNSSLVTGDIGGSAMETMTLSALLRTIAVDFPEVELVQLLVDGLEVETLHGHVDLTRPFRTKDWL